MWCSSKAGWTRITALSAVCTLVLMLAVQLAYRLALARVPQHRAALQRLVHSQTGLDVRFASLGLRWGWYGPEAVFSGVELDEPGNSNVVLRAPELTVGFDVWRTMRSGQLQPGRICLVAADIDLTGAGSRPAAQSGARRVGGSLRGGILQRWRDGRIDLDGGQVRWSDPAGAATPVSLQIRRATVQRSGDEWNLFALLFLPESLGRTALVVMTIRGALEQPALLSGSLRFEARRMSFAGWRELRKHASTWARYLPVAGSADVTVNLDFARGRMLRAQGSLYGGGLVVAPTSQSEQPLHLDRLRGRWRVVPHGSNWRVTIEALEMGTPAGRASTTAPASLTLDAGGGGDWLRGKLKRARLPVVAEIARWLAPHLNLAAAQLAGRVRELEFDWSRQRHPGKRLQIQALLEDLAVTAPSQAVVLSGLSAMLTGDEDGLVAQVQSRSGRLQLEDGPRAALDGLQLASQVRISRASQGWRIEVQRLQLRHEAMRLELSGSLTGGGSSLQPQIALHGELLSVDVAWIRGFLGPALAAGFGVTAESLRAGTLERAQFELKGALDRLPFDADGGVFTGSATLHDAVVRGGGQWPDASGIDARLQWQGRQIHCVVDRGRAGDLRLAAFSADWDGAKRRPAHFVGSIRARLENAIAWLREHRASSEYAAAAADYGLTGDTELNFDAWLPASPAMAPRIVASFAGARLLLGTGLLPAQDVAGSALFEGGRLSRSAVHGNWLGGPFTLRVTPRREPGDAGLLLQARGTADAHRLATSAGLDSRLDVGGTAHWTASIDYVPAAANQEPSAAARGAHWRARFDSNLAGIESRMLHRVVDNASDWPLHVQISGSDRQAQLRASLGERVKFGASLQKSGDSPWRVVLADLDFGSGQGRYAVCASEASAVAAADLGFPDAGLAEACPAFLASAGIAARTAAFESQLRIRSPWGAGLARWSAPGRSASPIQIRLTHLSVPDAPSDAGVEMASILTTWAVSSSRAARFSIDDLTWGARRLGHLSADVIAGNQEVTLTDVRLSGATHEGVATVHCAVAAHACRATFKLESSDAATTLADLGFRPEVSAQEGALSGDIGWPAASDRKWLETLRGRLNLRFADGQTRAASGEGTAASPSVGFPARTDSVSAGVAAVPIRRESFALLGIPGLLRAMAPQVNGAPQPQWLTFRSLEAAFDLQAGQATTADLHFDGDAEILMRGRTGLVTRDYDQQVWILKGEERLPSAVRRLGPTPRVAAAWLALREIFAGAAADSSHRVFTLRGSWDDPEAVAAQ